MTNSRAAAQIGIQKVVKLIDETVNNSTTLQNDDVLFLPVKVSKMYSFELHLFFDSATTPDLKRAFTVPSGATVTVQNAALSGGTPVDLVDGTTPVALAASGNDQYVFITGRLVMSTTPGTFQFQWAQQNLEASDTKVLKGSSLLLLETP